MTRVIKFRGMDLEGRWFYGLPCIIIVGRDRGSYTGYITATVLFLMIYGWE